MRQVGPPRRTQYKIGSSREPPSQNHHFNNAMLHQDFRGGGGGRGVLWALDFGFILASAQN